MATNPPGDRPENESRQTYQPNPTQPLQGNPTQPLYNQPQVPPPAPLQTQTYQPPASYTNAIAAKDPNTAMLLEMIPGFFGFLGIGYFYAGKTTDGIIRLVGWWIALFLLTLSLAVVIGICLLPIAVIAVPIVSGIMLKQTLQREQGLTGTVQHTGMNTTPGISNASGMTVPPSNFETQNVPAPVLTQGVSADTQKCPNCGAMNPNGARFCGECSTPLLPRDSSGLEPGNISTASLSSAPVAQTFTAEAPPTTGSQAAPIIPTSARMSPEPESPPVRMPDVLSEPVVPIPTVPYGGVVDMPTVETPQPVQPGSTNEQNNELPGEQPAQAGELAPPPSPDPQYSTLAEYEKSKTDDAPDVPVSEDGNKSGEPPHRTA